MTRRSSNRRTAGPSSVDPYFRASPIDRRQFVFTASGLILAAGFGASCGDDPTGNGSGGTGTVRVTINGLGAGVTSAGSALISGPNLESPINLPLPAAATGQAEVPVGTYHVVYTPPAGYAMAPGEPNELDVTVQKDQITDVVLDVVEATGTLRIVVTGLLALASSGGSAQTLRTDIGGQTPQTVNIPASGTIDSSVVPGTYRVTFTAPAGHQLAAGQTNPQDVVVTSGAVGQASFTVEEAVVGEGVVFHSDWSTATGATLAAYLDTAKEEPWDMKSGNGSLNQVLASTGLDFPSTNVYRSIAEYSGCSPFPCQTVFTDQVRLSHANLHIPIPGIGESLFYRWYQRYEVPDTIPTQDSSTPHSVQDGPAAGSTNWMWETPIREDGTWNPQFNFANANSFPNNRWITAPLPKHQTFRIEFQVHRVSATTFVPHARIFDSSNTQIMGDEDFLNRDGSLSFADETELGIENEAYYGGWQIGNNGPNWDTTPGQFPFNLWCHGCAAVRTDDWCGPYSGGI